MQSIFTKLILLFLFITIFEHTATGQGCVAIRNMGCSSSAMSTGGSTTGLLGNGEWQAIVGYRHFKSFRHFRGKHEEPHRVEEHTEVINYFNSFDLGLSRGFSDRFSMTVVLPLTFNDRSSLYEHYGNSTESNPNQERFHTSSAGIGDLRLSGTYWLIDPAKYFKGNIAVGLGVKAPTGKADVMDDFHKLDENGEDYIIEQAVDQSIQLGDGGWGVNLEVQGFHSLMDFASVYFNGFYLSNPRNVNNTLRRPHLDPDNPDSYYSVTDQYAARLGLGFQPSHSLGLSVGGRIEGIPAEDLIGDSRGRRRPGYAISVEPGVTYVHQKLTFNVNAPIAVFRNRVQSVQDIERSAERGEYTIGDAAFADYLINATVTYRFGGKHDMMPAEGTDIFKDVPTPKN